MCKAGQGSNCAGKENPVDILNITGTTSTSVITFQFTSTGNVPIETEVNGQGSTPTPSPNNPVTVPPNTFPNNTTSGLGSNGQSDYQVKVNSNPGKNEITSATYTVSCTNPARPSLSLAKAANPTTYTAANQSITYTYTVTNNGNVPITNVSISDDKIPGNISCAPSTLAPGATATCSAVYTTTIGDVGTGHVTNVATATGKDPSNAPVTSPTATQTVTLATTPSLKLSKSPSPSSFSAANQPITYTYTVENTGNVALTSISVSDNKIVGNIACAAALAPGASATCTAVYTTTGGDVGTGFVTNVATATGSDPNNAPVTSNQATATVTLNARPGLSLTKAANPTTYTGAGQPITYTYTVLNTGNVQLTNVSVSDNKIPGAIACSASLAPGASATCSAIYTTTVGDIGTGFVTNVATATGTDPGNAPVTSNTATQTVLFVAQPGLSLTKVANPTSYNNANETITYSYTVTNTGNVPLTTVSVADNKIPGSIACSALLAPGASATCTAPYTTTATDVTNGSVTNVATATGTDPGNAAVTSNTATVTIKRNDDFVRDRTKEVIKNFLYRRADQLLSNEPDRNRLIRRIPGSLWGGENSQAAAAGSTGSTFAASGGQGETTHIAFATSLSQLTADARSAQQKNLGDQRMSLGVGQGGSLKDQPLPTWNSGFDLWVEGHYTHFDDDQGNADRSGRLGVLYAGADYLLSPGLLVGALVQFDWMDDTSGTMNTSVEGHGWMAGPYMTARLSEHLFFDARAAWGQSDNTVNPLGFYTDSFETDRWMVRGNLTGNWNFGDWRFTPSVGVSRIEESQHAYINSIGIAIPGQDVALGRVNFGPELGYRFFASDGSAIEPMVSVQGLWDFEKPDSLTFGSEVVSPDDFRGKLEAGVMFSMPEGATVRAVGTYDGIGSNDFHAYGGQMWVNLPLH